MLIESKVLARCVWIECSECHVTSPIIEYGATWEDFNAADDKLREARGDAVLFWNTRAADGSVDSGAHVP